MDILMMVREKGAKTDDFEKFFHRKSWAYVVSWLKLVKMRLLFSMLLVVSRSLTDPSLAVMTLFMRTVCWQGCTGCICEIGFDLMNGLGVWVAHWDFQTMTN